MIWLNLWLCFLKKKKTFLIFIIIAYNVRGETQLHVAAIKENYTMVKKLIEDV
jgi:hypothetical protein